MSIQRVWLILFGAVLSCGNVGASENVQKGKDLLDISNGAVLISATSEYNQKWAAMMLIDGTETTGWCSSEGKTQYNTLLFELSDTYTISSFVIDNSKVQEGEYPGISVKDFRLSLSKDSSKEGFQTILEALAAKGEKSEFDLKETVAGQWLKLEFLSNWGHTKYTESMELEAYGELVEKSTPRNAIKGVFETNYGLVYLQQDDGDIQGCYDWDNGRINGTTDGRVIRAQWSEDRSQTGSTMMVLTQDGTSLNGLWYEKGRYKGLWYGSKVTDGRLPKCKAEIENDSDENQVGRSLDSFGRVIVYGIYFDFDSAAIRSDSVKTLKQIYSAISNRPELDLVIEGHTDSKGSGGYNMSLSQSRAKSVVDWLVSKGINGHRLTPKGFGESRPVADNSKPDGRALNRRVEIVVQ